MFKVCLLTEKWKSISQVCKLKVNSGVICQLTIQRNCLQQRESSLTHTDISCARHAAFQAKCCCKCLCCSFYHSNCGSSQQTSGGCGQPRNVAASICLSRPGRNGEPLLDGPLPLQPTQGTSASLCGLAWCLIHCPAGICSVHPACLLQGAGNLLPAFRGLGFSAVVSQCCLNSPGLSVLVFWHLLLYLRLQEGGFGVQGIFSGTWNVFGSWTDPVGAVCVFWAQTSVLWNRW